jgi:hypothetical protein
LLQKFWKANKGINIFDLLMTDSKTEM